MEYLPIFLAASLAWLFTLLAVPFTDGIRNISRRKNFIRLCDAELKLLQGRLAATAFRLVGRFGEYDEEFLSWYVRSARKSGLEVKIVELVEKCLLRATEEAIFELSESMKAKSGALVLPSRLSLSFLVTNLDSLKLFDVAVQRQVVDILTQLSFFNSAVDEAWFFYTKTFDVSLTKDDRAAINSNLQSNYGNMTDRARWISDRIDALGHNKKFQTNRSK